MSTTKRRTVHGKTLFLKDIRPMLFAFGDSPVPAADSVAMMEDILLDYLADICTRAHKISQSRAKRSINTNIHMQKLRLNDLTFILRKDQKKLDRIEELLVLQEDIKKARAGIEMTEIVGGLEAALAVSASTSAPAPAPRQRADADTDILSDNSVVPEQGKGKSKRGSASTRRKAPKGQGRVGRPKGSGTATPSSTGSKRKRATPSGTHSPQKRNSVAPA